MHAPLFAARLAVLALPLLSGCDLAVAGVCMPGVMPGVGFPVTGVVLDADSRLPIGGATVVSGLGSTITDATGHFNLYGNMGSREVSVSRAGYTAVTLGGLDFGVCGPPSDDLQVTLSTQTSKGTALPQRFLEVSGAVTGLPQGKEGRILFGGGGRGGLVSNGLYTLSWGAGAPGHIFSAALAWGVLTGHFTDEGEAPQSFSFSQFGYEIKNWPLGDTIPAARALVAAWPIDMADQTKSVPMGAVHVSYSNLGTLQGVQTDVLLDFGVMGAVPVARAFGSNQDIPVPRKEGLKYVVNGRASDTANRVSSTVTITTNDPSKNTFQLLSVPKVVAPAAGASQVGQRPTFKWTALPTRGVVYQITVFEAEDLQPKWIGRTDEAEITFPGFSSADINGGALRPDKKYNWTLKAIDVLDEGETPSAARDNPVPVKPFRVRERESEVSGSGFTI